MGQRCFRKDSEITMIIDFEGKPVEVPDDASDAEVSSILSQMAGAQQPIQTPKAPSFGKQIINAATPTMNFLANAVGSVTEPIAKMATGIVAKPVSDIAGLAATGYEALTGNQNPNLPAQFKQELQQRMTYQPMTTAGKSDYNPINAAQNLVGAAIRPLQQATPTDSSTFSGMAANAYNEALPQALSIAGAKYGQAGIANAPAKIAQSQAELDILKGENAARDAIQRAANKIDLTVPATGGAKLAASTVGVGNRAISNRNAFAATRATRQELGLPKGSALSEDTLSVFKKEQYKAYDKLLENAGDAVTVKVPSTILDATGKPIVTNATKNGMLISDTVKNSLKDDLVALQKEMEQSPTAFKANTEGIKLIQEVMSKDVVDPKITFDQIRALRRQAKTDFLSKDSVQQSLAPVKLKVANALEQSFEDALLAKGKTELLDEFKKARTNLAKANFIENIVDPSGLVSIQKAARLSDKFPLTGHLKTIADFGKTFEAASMKPTSTSPYIRPIDYLVATGSAMGGHALVGASEIAGRAGFAKLAEKGMLQNKIPNYKVSTLQKGSLYGVPGLLSGLAMSAPSKKELP